MVLDLISLVAFLVLTLGAFFVTARMRGLRGALEDQLASEAAGKFVGTSLTPTDDGLPSIVAAPDDLTRDLRRAGYYKPTASEEFAAMRAFGTLVCMVLTAIFVVVLGGERRDLFWTILMWGFALSALAYSLPWLFVRLSARGRVERIQRALPDAFDMLTMCLTGGMGVQEALSHVSRETYFSHPDLATELEIVRRHSELTTLGEAFRQWALRIDAPEVQSLTALVNQSERLGSNVVGALRDYADGVRLQQRQTADERANKAGIKLLFPLVLCLAPAAMIILWGPAALELRNFFRGFAGTNANQPGIRSQQ